MSDYVSLNFNQRRVFDAAMEWWKGDRSEPFEISGPPGTGKTYLIDTIIDYLGLDRSNVAPLAYTGAAAINMRFHGMINAKTIHSWLYKPVMEYIYDENGNIVMDPVFNKPKTKIVYIEKDPSELSTILLFVADEAGTIPPSMRVTMEKYNIPIIAAGDIDQLPPIHGKPAFLNDPSKIHFLTEIMRQSLNSGIVQISQMLREGYQPHCGMYSDAIVIRKHQLTYDMLVKSKIILCGRNATRDEFNDLMRGFHGYKGELPNPGERVVCRKNNWDMSTLDGINLTNGLLGVVCNDPRYQYFRNEDKFIMDFMPDIGYDPSSDPALHGFFGLECSYKYFTADHANREKLRQSPYITNERFEFGYAITTHMSQGSEYDNGIYIEEPLMGDVKRDINRKLNYVGITRFRKFCIYVKSEKHFE